MLRIFPHSNKISTTSTVKYQQNTLFLSVPKNGKITNLALVFKQKAKSATSDNDADVEKLCSKIRSYRWRRTLKKSLARLGP